MFNVGRNNPRVRAALIEALELDLPGSVQLGVIAAAAAARRGAAARARRRGSSACSSRAPAPRRSRRRSSSAAPRRGRPRVVSAEHGFHGLTLGSLSANGNAEFTDALRAAAAGLRPGAVRRSRRARGASCGSEDVAALPRRAGAGEGRAPAARRLPRGRAGALPPLRDALLRRRGADRLRPHRASCSRSSTGGSSPISSRSRSRSPAATCRSARC